MKSLKLVLLIFSLSLVSCSSLNPVKAIGSALGGGDSTEVDTEVVAGDKDEHNETQVGNRSQQEASEITNINEIPPLVLLVMVLGWLLPSPAEIWKGFTRLLPWVD